MLQTHKCIARVFLQEQEGSWSSKNMLLGITCESKPKINSNLNNKIISKPVMSKDLRNRNEKLKSSKLNDRIF